MKRNKLEEACHFLGRNFTRVENINVAVPYLRSEETRIGIAAHIQAHLETLKRIIPSIRIEPEVVQSNSSGVLDDAVEAATVAALTLWHTALEEYYFSLLMIISQEKPSLLPQSGEFTIGKVAGGSTMRFRLVNTFNFLVDECIHRNNVHFDIKLNKETIVKLNKIRRGVVHHGERLETQFVISDYTRDLYHASIEIATCLSGVVQLELHLGRILED